MDAIPYDAVCLNPAADEAGRQIMAALVAGFDSVHFCFVMNCENNGLEARAIAPLGAANVICIAIAMLLAGSASEEIDHEAFGRTAERISREFASLRAAQKRGMQ